MQKHFFSQSILGVLALIILGVLLQLRGEPVTAIVINQGTNLSAEEPIPVSGKPTNQAPAAKQTDLEASQPTRPKAAIIPPTETTPIPTSVVSPEAPLSQPASTTIVQAAPTDPTADLVSTPAAVQAELVRDPNQWKSWPVMPTVSESNRQLYLEGLAAGNDPHAFSILGDCQSQPDVFLGRFDSDPGFVGTLPIELQGTISQFSGSFDRYSPTVKDGSTEGAMLWSGWNDNKEGKCEPGETPLDCELRVHNPSIVFVHLGTHYEVRNYQYLHTVVETLLEHKVLPVIVTKADNRELDERINHNIVSIAAEYDLPLWNFWASVQHIDNQGLKIGSNMYLSKPAEEIHRMGAVEALHTVWQAIKE